MSRTTGTVMHNGYVLTLAAIESRLYTNESDSIFMRWPTAEKELPRGNHTPDGLSATCLHFMEDIMTRTGRPNHKWDSFLFLHFGGWDFLIDYARKDAKRRGYLLRCEEKGYSVSGDRVYFDECLVSERPVKGVIAAVPSTAMKCIVDANVYLVRNFCGLYSDAGMDTLCSEIRRFLETGPDEEKTLAPQMNAQDRYCIFMYIRSCLDKYEAARDDAQDSDVLSRHLGTALAWLLLAALLRDSCENLCRLIPSPSIQLLRVQIREASASPLPAVAPSSLPPVPAHFLGRESELEILERHFHSSSAPFFITGEGACGKTSLAAAFAAAHSPAMPSVPAPAASERSRSAGPAMSAGWTGIYAIYSGDLKNTIASIRFRDTEALRRGAPSLTGTGTELCSAPDCAYTDALYRFNMSRITQYGSRILLIIDNMDAPQYDRTFTELLSQPLDPGSATASAVAGPASASAAAGRTNADILEELQRTGAALLFTTRTTAPPQYHSMCLSAPEHEFPLRVLLDLSKEIYSDCAFTEYDEVLMSQIILAVGKHVLMVELLSAALQQQSGFSSMEEVLDRITSLRLPGIRGEVTTRKHPAPAASVYELIRNVFSFSLYGEEMTEMLRLLSLLSPLGMDMELFMHLADCTSDQYGLNSGRPVSTETSDSIRRTLLRLRDLHLVAIEPRTAHISMHPVIADVAAADLRPDLSNCDQAIGKAIAFYDPDSTAVRDVRHLSQIRAMCERSFLVLGGNGAVGAKEPQDASAGSDALPQTASAAPSKTDPSVCRIRLSAAVSRIEYYLGNYRNALLWADRSCLEYTGSRPGLPALYAESLKCAAQALSKLGQYEKAKELYEEEVCLLADEAGEAHPETAYALNDLGVVLEEMGDPDAAMECLLKAWEILEKLFGADSPEIASTCNNLGMVCADLGDPETAEAYYRQSLDITRKHYGESHPETAVLYSNLGELLMNARESGSGGSAPEEARRYFEKALEICTSAFGPDYPANACTLSNLGILEDMEGNYQEARSCYERALRIQSSVAGPDHPHCADILHNLAVSYIEEAFAEADGEDANDQGAGDCASPGSAADLTLLRKALEQDRRALSIARSRLGDGHPMTIMLEDSVRWLNEKLGIET